MDLCCEIVRRLREDINRIFFDGKVYTSIETVYETKVLKYDSVVNEFNAKSTCVEKIASFSSLAQNKRMEQMLKAMEFFEFIKLTRHLLELKLERKCKHLQFMSCNGLPLGLYLKKLSDFITLVEKNYIGLFTHPGCVAAYHKLEKQIKTSLSSMMSSCDGLEGAIAYVDSAVPLLSNLIRLMDNYNSSPLVDFHEFYSHKFLGHVMPKPLPKFDYNNASLSLYCILDTVTDTTVENTTPVVTTHSPERFIKTARELAKTIFESDFVERRPISAIGVTGINNGCLDPHFLDTLHTLPLNHLNDDLPNTRRSRGRPRKLSLPKNESFKYAVRVSNDPLSISELE